MTPQTLASRFALCISNDGYAASLEPWKLYQVVPDRAAEALDHLRVIDESGEDYVYPRGLFHEVDLPAAVQKELRRAS